MQFNLFLAYNAVDPAPIGPKTLYIPSVLLHCTIVQRSAKVGAPGLVNFVTVVAYHFFLSLAAAFTQPIQSLLASPCTAALQVDPIVLDCSANCNLWRNFAGGCTMARWHLSCTKFLLYFVHGEIFVSSSFLSQVLCRTWDNSANTSRAY